MTLMQFHQSSQSIMRNMSRLFNRIKDIAFISPLTSMWAKRNDGKLRVYLYHRVDEVGEHPFMDVGGSPNITPQELYSDLRFLRNQGFEFVRFDQIEHLQFEENKRYACITFDDGFASVYDNALPIAQELQIPTTIFQCSAMVQGQKPLWEHHLYWLFSESARLAQFELWWISQVAAEFNSSMDVLLQSMGAIELQKILNEFAAAHADLYQELELICAVLYPSVTKLQLAQQAGHEIASHGQYHYRRDKLNEQEFITELRESKRQLSAYIGQSPTSFSYPFNSYFAEDEILCAKLYDRTATVDGGSVYATTPLSAIPRCTHPGRAKNVLRQRRWLLTGCI